MKKIVSCLMITLIFVGMLTLTYKIPTIKANDRIVGVKIDDWAKYDWIVSWSSDNPSPPIPEPPSWVFDVKWLMNTVQTIIDTEITFQFVIRLENGTDLTQTMSVDVDTGHGIGASFFISANLSAGDSIFASPEFADDRINETISRTCAGVTRDINYLNWSRTMDYTIDYTLFSHSDVYWDKTTGVLCEYEELLTFTHKTKGYVTSQLLVLKLIETNIWGALVVPATIDIHPQALNLRSKGKWITAYVELPEGYKVKDVDLSTVMLNGTISAEVKPHALGTRHLIVKFDRTQVISYILDNVDIEERFTTITLTITGKLNDGTPFQGSDTIKIIIPMLGHWRFLELY